MDGDRWRTVPVGIDADRWVTRSGCRTVLVVVHTLVTGQRLLDVADLIESDTRVQVVYTAGPDVFDGGVSDFLHTIGALVIPWQQAIRERFALAVTAAYGGIHELHAPVMVLPHGAGYGKRIVGVGRGTQQVERSVYGLGTQHLVRDGRVVPSVVALSHEAQRLTLLRQCPQAEPAAVVVGDPCFDQLRASTAHRDRYRAALGVAPDRQLVVLTSTWGTSSLFAQTDLLPLIMNQLDSRRYRVAALLHPAAWFGHGQRQVRAWLRDCLDAGLVLLEPEVDWRAVAVAADLVLGDHGSTTIYAASLGVPVLHTQTSLADLDASSPQALLVSRAPQLNRATPVEEQLDEARTAVPQWRDELVASLTSRPGQANRLLRREMYRLLDLSVPGRHRALQPVPTPDLSRKVRRHA